MAFILPVSVQTNRCPKKPGAAQVEIGFAEVSVRHVVGEHVISGDEDLVGDGERGAQAAASALWRWYLSLR
jgi:hypothetical protein